MLFGLDVLKVFSDIGEGAIVSEVNVVVAHLRPVGLAFSQDSVNL